MGRTRKAESLQLKRKLAVAEEAAACKGSYWMSLYQGPCWVCECCAEHNCKDPGKHCHRATTGQGGANG